MTTITAVVRDGRIELDEPLDLPNGTVLQIPLPLDMERTADEPMTPEEIQKVLTAMDRMEPLQMTNSELAAWESDRKARKEREKSQFFEQGERLQRMWE